MSWIVVRESKVTYPYRKDRIVVACGLEAGDRPGS